MKTIRNLAFGVLAILCFGNLASAQTYSLLGPPGYQFFDSAGKVLASGKICTYLSGTTTPSATYTDSSGTLATNPIILDSAGRPSAGAIYLAAPSYRFVARRVGTDGAGTCPGGAGAGSQQWSRDDVKDGALFLGTTFSSKNINGIRMVDQFSGTGGSAKFQAAIADIPSTGGNIMACALEGTQTLTSDVFSSVTKPITIQFCTGATYSASANLTIPSNITLDFSQGAIISPGVGTTLTITGGVAGSMSQHFAGAGTVSFVGNHRVSEVYSEWWGAVADNSTDNSTTLNSAITAAKGSLIPLHLMAGTYQANTAVSSVVLNILSSTGLTLIGAGSQNTFIKTTLASADLMAAISVDFANPRYILSGFTLLGPDTGATTTSGNGLRISGAAVPLGRISDVRAYYFKGSGKAGVWLDALENASMRDVEVQLNDVGLKLTGGFNGNSVWNILAGQNNTQGIYSSNVGSNFFGGIVVQSNLKSGWIMDGNFNSNSIQGLHIENNNSSNTASTYALSMLGSASKGSVQGNVFNSITWNAVHDVMYIAGESGYTVTHNTFNNSVGTVALTIGNAYETDNDFYRFVSLGNITGWNAADLILPNPSGTYAPTVTTESNLDSAFAYNTATYLQVGNIITVYGLGGYNATAASAATFRMTLPVASNLTAITQLFGVGTDEFGKTMYITGDATNDAAEFAFVPGTTGDTNFTFTFSYKIR